MIKNIAMIIVAVAVGMAGMFYYKSLSEATDEAYVTVTSIKKIAELATVEYVMSVHKQRKKKKKLLQLKDARFLVILTGKIKGSVDLNRAKLDIDKEKKFVSIDFNKDAVRISNPEIAPGDLQFITISNPAVINKIDDDDRNSAQSSAIRLLRDTAIKKGIESKTREQAKVLLENFLASLGYSSKITFK